MYARRRHHRPVRACCSRMLGVLAYILSLPVSAALRAVCWCPAAHPFCPRLPSPPRSKLSATSCDLAFIAKAKPLVSGWMQGVGGRGARVL